MLSKQPVFPGCQKHAVQTGVFTITPAPWTCTSCELESRAWKISVLQEELEEVKKLSMVLRLDPFDGASSDEPPSLLAAAQALHMANIGATDIPDHARDRIVTFIKYRLSSWSESSVRYDEKVRSLLEMVLAETSQVTPSSPP